MAIASFSGFILQESPKIFVAQISGKWLITHTTTSWRKEKPVRGFQRIVNEDRCRKMAVSVLDEQRNFPNAVVLASDSSNFVTNGAMIEFPEKCRYLIIDGQHRIWAQNFSDYIGQYATIIHTGLNEVAMAKLFLEINDNQKRVPSSLRWDLVRLVQPEEKMNDITAAELTYELATDRSSPFYEEIDLTGENPELRINQGSLAPEIKTIVSKIPFKEFSFEKQVMILVRYFAAVKSLDPDGWRNGTGVFYKARVLRALIRLLPEILVEVGGTIV